MLYYRDLQNCCLLTLIAGVFRASKFNYMSRNLLASELKNTAYNEKNERNIYSLWQMPLICWITLSDRAVDKIYTSSL
jgi:hypothetical protein